MAPIPLIVRMPRVQTEFSKHFHLEADHWEVSWNLGEQENVVLYRVGCLSENPELSLQLSVASFHRDAAKDWLISEYSSLHLCQLWPQLLVLQNPIVVRGPGRIRVRGPKSVVVLAGLKEP